MPLSERRQVLFTSNFGSLVLLSQGAGGGGGGGGRHFNFIPGGGGGGSPLDPLLPPLDPLPPSALIHLRIRVLGTFFRLGHFFPPAPWPGGGGGGGCTDFS